MSLFKRLFKGKMEALQSIGQSQAITGNFNLTATLGQSGKSMQVAGYIYDGESQESLEGRIAIMRDIMDKEKILAEIPELEARREQLIKGLSQAGDVLAELKEKQEKGTLSSQERLNMRNHSTNLKRMQEEIDKGTQAIAQAKKKAGVR